MAQKPTTTMIAREANVSRASVYAVLNSPANTNIGVSEEKRKRILKVAQQLGYVRNATAQSLKTGKYRSIGVIAQSIAHAQFYRFFNTFDEQACKNGYFTFLTSSEFDCKREEQKLNAILEQGVDALVIGLLHHEKNYETLKKYYQRNIPVIILGNVLGRNQQAMLAGFDEAAGALKIAEYLYASDLSQLAYFKLFNEEDLQGTGFDARANYFTAACNQVFGDCSIDMFSCSKNDLRHAGDAFAKQFMKKYNDRRLPQAVICSNDVLAFDTINAFTHMGIKVPEDISVIGYDNLNIAGSNLELTTLDLPYEQLAESCWNLLQPFLDDNAPETKPEPVMISPQLLIRETSPCINQHENELVLSQ